jgi:hypothetical protein
MAAATANATLRIPFGVTSFSLFIADLLTGWVKA